MSTLYIRLPSRAAADSMQNEGAPLTCRFASVSNSGALERDGVAALSELAEPVRRAQRVVLLLAASDVTLLRVKVPPMSAARLKMALPNLIEDQLMSDPAESVVVAGDMADGLRTVAVVSRGWLELLNKTLIALGARSLAAVPAQLCLPHEDGRVTAAISEYGGADVEVAVRLSAQEGIGLPVYAELPESAPVEAIQALSAIVPQAPVALAVPQPRVASYQDALRLTPALEERITLSADSWTRWIAGAGRASIDLMQGLGAAAGPAINWRPWRWSLALAAALLAVNAFGLNIDWLRMKREADGLKANMIQTYKAAYPKDPVIIDPLTQMQRKVAEAQRDSGQIAPDDFIALAAGFGEAWAASGQGPKAIAGLEYHDRSLSVKLKPDASVPLDQIKTALATHNLTLSQPGGAGVWQIRSGK
ncbi:general secretion pathway protein GspL [Noviherbaspirillum cavernae]|uniref:General secretion pathway protein GspL n=1 Tax=Noviherbaspirillum cavernae TaxID=2320862 RepID=A0A418WXD5_9BURK|nr:type II secretion system protein GspL [Noviherbaspirillum cavernae]RJG04909.1 general secretion pathway protein GspL [Noviherbaspirillum cavernae]